MNSTPLEVLFIWHFHQPYYRVPGSREFVLPWVRLHSVKSYYDMGRLLEKRPEIRATFNFSGSLLRQLVEIVDEGLRDRWWRWSTTDPDALDHAQRREIVRHFFSISYDRGVAPLPRFAELHQQRNDKGIAACADTFTRQDFLDLQVLFNLAWCGFSAREDFPILNQLRKKGRNFTEEDRQALLEVHLLITAKILPLYRDLAERDQIEITVTPMYHPIIPLLIDTETAARPTPRRPRPPRYQAREDARHHIESALDLAQGAFGRRPDGMWPSEGSVSPEAVDLFAEAGLSWIATDEDILRCSRRDRWNRDTDLWRPWIVEEQPLLRIFFRDHGLSDQIGFVYSNNPADHAADDLIGHLRRIAGAQKEQACVAIILDGENPWEHYEDDGRPFLSALYDRLESDSQLRTNLPTNLCDDSADQVQPHRLDYLHSGSWIMANYQIWIGHDETNRAWDWVRRASKRLQKALDETPDHPGLQQARRSLHVAQGSDWFWWYGDDFSSEQDDQFDALFRAVIAEVWRSLDDRPPAELGRPIHHHTPQEAQEAEITPPRRFINPEIDGSLGDFFAWIGAGHITIAGGHGAMYETFRPLQSIYFGFSHTHAFLRLAPGSDFSRDSRFQVHLKGPAHAQTLPLEPGSPQVEGPEMNHVFGEVAELSISLDSLGLSPGDDLEFWISVERDGLQIQRFPVHDVFTISVPTSDPAHQNWLV